MPHLSRPHLEGKAELHFHPAVVGRGAAAGTTGAAAETRADSRRLRELRRVQVADVAGRIDVIEHIVEHDREGHVVAMLGGFSAHAATGAAAAAAAATHSHTTATAATAATTGSSPAAAEAAASAAATRSATVGHRVAASARRS